MMVDFMKWALTDGQKFAPTLGYAPLPDDVVKLEMAALAKIKVSSVERRMQRSDLGVSASGTGAVRLRARSLIVVAHRRSSWRASRCCRSRSSASSFWRTADLGSGRRRVRRAAVHLGHAVLVDPRAADRDADRARHRRSSSPSCARLRCGSRWCSSPSCWPRFRRSSTACGASSCWCRRSARSRRRCPTSLRQLPLFSGPPLGVGMLAAGADPRDHGHPVHLVGRARGAQVGAGRAARRRLRARRHALRGDSRGAVLRAHRHRRRRHARLRPRARRDDGGDDGDRQQPEGVGVAVRAAVHDGGGASPTSSPRRPTSSTCTRWSRSAWCCSSSR